MAIDAILAATRRDLAARQAARPLDRIRAGLAPSDRPFRRALEGPGPAFILEVKPRSPSEGDLRDPAAMAPAVAAYARHASAVSVLTDRPFFGGSPELLARVRATVPQPVLCKDFIVDPYQVYEARAHGADAVLLMLSVLDDATWRACAAAAAALGMGTLTEVHDAAEMRRARTLGADVIGINNRDLRTLGVSLDVTRALAAAAPAGALLIAESGIRGPADVAALRPLVDGFLVGTALMRAPDPDRATRALVFGRTKICGLTREADAAAAAAAGATHGGLVFAPESPRCVTEAAAARVRAAAPLDWVGVFVNEDPARVAALATALDLAAVQLHGEESPEQVAALRPRLPAGCAVWKAVRVTGPVPPWQSTGADLVLLDGHAAGRRGGTGHTFDWGVLAGMPDLDRYGVGGGLHPGNAAAAAMLGAGLLDASSRLERAPGVKDADVVRRFLEARRGPRRGEAP
jgi:indole-3-glycerol phosphate synthase / phosphoribosylanthranilate isomerase